MKFTGERAVPGQGDVDLWNEHRARYLFAQRLSTGKRVLDVACGSGYGSDMLSQNASLLLGIDNDQEAIQYCRLHYTSAKTCFIQADCLALPFTSGRFEVVVALEIIEHLADAASFLRELQRVLAPAGLLILSTPNRLYYTEDRGEVNPFHQREFSYSELDQLLGSEFPHFAILLENHVAGLLIADSRQAMALGEHPPMCCQATIPDSVSPVPLREREANYLIAVCSGQPLPAILPLLYLPSSGNVLRERETHIRSLEDQLAEARQERDSVLARTRALESQLDERTHWAAELDRKRAEKEADLIQLQADYDRKIAWAQELDREVERARAALDKLQVEFEDRTAWALKMNTELHVL